MPIRAAPDGRDREAARRTVPAAAKDDGVVGTRLAALEAGTSRGIKREDPNDCIFNFFRVLGLEGWLVSSFSGNGYFRTDSAIASVDVTDVGREVT